MGLPGEFQREKALSDARLELPDVGEMNERRSIGYRPSHTPTLTEAFQVLIRIIV